MSHPLTINAEISRDWHIPATGRLVIRLSCPQVTDIRPHLIPSSPILSHPYHHCHCYCQHNHYLHCHPIPIKPNTTRLTPTPSSYHSHCHHHLLYPLPSPCPSSSHPLPSLPHLLSPSHPKPIQLTPSPSYCHVSPVPLSYPIPISLCLHLCAIPVPSPLTSPWPSPCHPHLLPYPHPCSVPSHLTASTVLPRHINVRELWSPPLRSLHTPQQAMGCSWEGTLTPLPRAPPVLAATSTG